MRALAALALFAAPAFAHMMSMSTGDATVEGSHVEYILRMPVYEAPDSKSLLDHVRFSSGGIRARVLHQECHEDAAHATWLCAGYYEFPKPVKILDVDCTLYQVTVPNHVHLLRAMKAGKTDQAIFDYTFTRATLLFRPATAWEKAVQQGAAGALRSVSGWIQILFLLALALAARSRRELLALGGMFLAGQIAGALIPWYPPPRFVESASALTVAYLAVEILFLPEAGLRWLIAACLGGFHGLYFALFLRNSEYRAVWVLTGAALLESACLAAAGALFLVFLSRHYRRVPAAALLAVGFGWFFIRLKG